MKQLLIASIALSILGSARSPAQSMEDMNLQIHGYATQGFVYSTNNNWDTTDSTNGSAAWTEAVVNLTAQPQRRLRIGVQARYFVLGNYGNAITVDWAEADVKVNEKFGFRVGKVKTPAGLLNETQDIDPAHPWILLPQSIYPEASRNSILAHFGGVLYGTVPLGETLGTLEYRVFGGERVIASNDGFFQPYRDAGVSPTDSLTGAFYGGTLHWNTPIEGLMLGVDESFERLSGAVTAGPYLGFVDCKPFMPDYFFGRYEHNKFMIEGEYGRIATRVNGKFPMQRESGFPGMTISLPFDWRAFYAISSYRLAEKLTGGLYYSSTVDREAPISSARYQKDWALFSRYDFSPYVYLKLEQHFVDGTLRGFSTSNNAAMRPDTRMTLLKLGVSF